MISLHTFILLYLGGACASALIGALILFAFRGMTGGMPLKRAFLVGITGSLIWPISLFILAARIRQEELLARDRAALLQDVFSQLTAGGLHLSIPDPEDAVAKEKKESN